MELLEHQLMEVIACKQDLRQLTFWRDVTRSMDKTAAMYQAASQGLGGRNKNRWQHHTRVPQALALSPRNESVWKPHMSQCSWRNNFWSAKSGSHQARPGVPQQKGQEDNTRGGQQRQEVYESKNITRKKLVQVLPS